MSNTIIVNKRFNTAFISQNVRDILMPRWSAHDNQQPQSDKYFDMTTQHYRYNHQKVIDRTMNYGSEDYNDMNTYQQEGYLRNVIGTNGTNLKNYTKPSPIMIATQGYVDLLEKINGLLYNKQIPLTHTNTDESHTRFLNMLGSYELSTRRLAFNYLLGLGLITQAEYDATALNSCGLDQFKTENFTWTYEPINDYFIIKHTSPLKLETRWVNSVNNPNNEQLYILIENSSSFSFNGYDKNDWAEYTRISATKFYRQDTNSFIYQYSFLGYTLGDMSSSANIKFDHVNKIDYIDTLEIAIKLPRIYN